MTGRFIRAAAGTLALFFGLRRRSTVGDYGELFERNVGGQSPIGFERGLNGLWIGGGLMYAPLLRQ